MRSSKSTKLQLKPAQSQQVCYSSSFVVAQSPPTHDEPNNQKKNKTTEKGNELAADPEPKKKNKCLPSSWLSPHALFRLQEKLAHPSCMLLGRGCSSSMRQKPTKQKRRNNPVGKVAAPLESTTRNIKRPPGPLLLTGALRTPRKQNP